MPRREWYFHSFFILLIAVCGLGACIAFLAQELLIPAVIMLVMVIVAEYGMARVVYKMRMLYK